MPPKRCKCDICEKILSEKGNLTRHIKLIHNDNKIYYKCEQCDKQFSQNCDLNRHIKNSHSKDMLYSCEICHKSYKYKHYIKKHMMIHTGERPFNCDICGKYFIQKKGCQK